MLEKSSSRGAVASSHGPVCIQAAVGEGQEEKHSCYTAAQVTSRLTCGIGQKHHTSLFPRGLKPHLSLLQIVPQPLAGDVSSGVHGWGPLGQCLHVQMWALSTEPLAADQPPAGLGKTDFVLVRSLRGQAWRPNSEDGSGVGIILETCTPTLERVEILAPWLFPSSRRLQSVSVLYQVRRWITPNNLVLWCQNPTKDVAYMAEVLQSEA